MSTQSNNFTLIGNGFDKGSGIFTAPKHGLYQFTISYDAYRTTYIFFLVNNRLVERVRQMNGNDAAEDRNSNSHTLVQTLSQADQVHLTLGYTAYGGYIYASSFFPVTFVGSLISENV